MDVPAVLLPADEPSPSWPATERLSLGVAVKS
jgi:hypothetical protein